MKNTIILTAIVLPFSFLPQKGFSQLEVIDKIAGVLIPGVTSGIKTILESTNGKKVNKDEVKKLESDLMQKFRGLIEDIDNDASNIAALNEIFSIAGVLYDDIGAMKALTNNFLLEQIDLSKNHLLLRETAILFASEWRQVERKKDRLISLTENASSGSVQDDIAQYVQNLDEALTDLESVLKLSKDPDLKMDMEESNLYIQKLKRSGEHINKIEEAVEDINVQLATRIRSFKASLDKTKNEIEKIGSNSNK